MNREKISAAAAHVKQACGILRSAIDLERNAEIRHVMLDASDDLSAVHLGLKLANCTPKHERESIIAAIGGK